MMFLIAITAVTRKIAVLDANEIDPIAMLGIAAILAVLVAGFYVVKTQQARGSKSLISCFGGRIFRPKSA